MSPTVGSSNSLNQITLTHRKDINFTLGERGIVAEWKTLKGSYKLCSKFIRSAVNGLCARDLWTSRAEFSIVVLVYCLPFILRKHKTHRAEISVYIAYLYGLFKLFELSYWSGSILNILLLFYLFHIIIWTLLKSWRIINTKDSRVKYERFKHLTKQKLQLMHAILMMMQS